MPARWQRRPCVVAALVLQLVTAQHRESRGYLFVSNRLDEVMLAASQLKRVDAHANTTLVADAATLGELASRSKLGGAAKRLFDVVIASETLLPGTRTTDSMGFRLQKLRALRHTPYDKTLYLDSDTLACQDPQPLFDALEVYDAGGVAQHATIVNGGVQVYKRNAHAFALYKKWETLFSEVKETTRREQPILQEALRWAEENTPLKYGRLDRTFNCRGADTCAKTTLKSGETGRCVIIHGKCLSERTPHHHTTAGHGVAAAAARGGGRQTRARQLRDEREGSMRAFRPAITSPVSILSYLY